MPSNAYKLGYGVVVRAIKQATAFPDIDASRTINKELNDGVIHKMVEHLSDDEIAELLRGSPDRWSRARGHGYSWGQKAKWPAALAGLIAGLIPGKADDLLLKGILGSGGAGAGYLGGRFGGSAAGHVRGMLSSAPNSQDEMVR